MPTAWISPGSCGTHAPGWLNGAHPTLAEGQVTSRSASLGITAVLGPLTLKYEIAAITSCITSREPFLDTHVDFATVVLSKQLLRKMRPVI